MAVIKFEALGTDKDSAWDAGENVKRLKADQPQSYYDQMFAWRTDDADGNKSDYKFPHHLVSEDGDVGKASIKACTGGIASLNGGRNKPDIPDDEFEGVYNHLKKHYQEAGIEDEDIPELKSRSSHGEAEYRSAEVRASIMGGADGEPVVRCLSGQPIVFNQRAQIYEDYEGTKYYEQIDSDALDGVDLSNVVLKYNHSDHVPILAATRAGTLDLDIGKTGLDMKARLANTTHANDIHELVSSGHLDKMSFAFRVAEDSYDPKTKTRTIHKFAVIRDVSVVDFPAYEGTSVSARSYFQAQEETRRREERRRQQEEAEQRCLEAQRLEEQRQQEVAERKRVEEREQQRQKLALRALL